MAERPRSFHRLRWTTYFAVGLIWIAQQGLATGRAPTDPWQVLDSLRRSLGAAPLQADFVQQFRPAGFSGTDTESGTLSLSLPACLRWDYLDPFPKTFLLCDQEVHTWDPGERAGRRFIFSAADEPGIDLLRLQIEDLRKRYEASLDAADDGSRLVTLTPRQLPARITRAQLRIDAASGLLRELSYEDREGNESRFLITAYSPLQDSDVFQPPGDLEWLDQ